MSVALEGRKRPDLFQGMEEVLSRAAVRLYPEQEEDLLALLLAFERGYRSFLRPRGFLLANGTGTGKTYVYGAFASLASRHLPVLVVVPNEGVMEQNRAVLEAFPPGGHPVEVTTYGRMERYLGFDGLLVFDEAHFLKNLGPSGSKRARTGYELAKRAAFVLYVTATPFDRPWEAAYLSAVGVQRLTGDRRFEDFVSRFGVGKREVADGRWEYYFHGTLEDLRRFYHTLSSHLFLRKRLFAPPPGLVSYEAPRLSLPKEERQLLLEVRRRLREAAREAPPEHRGLVMAFRSALSRGILERLKLRQALPLIEEELASGRHVALFLAFRQESLLDLSGEEEVGAYLDRKAATTKGVLAPHVARALAGMSLELPSPLALVEERFGHLGPALAFYTGRESPSELRRAKERWERGEVRLLVVTNAKGGVGLSLHDVFGHRPTTQVVLTLPWTAIELDQILGRVVRVGVRSPVKVVLPLAPSPVEAQLGKVIASRLKTLGYAVRGGAEAVPREILEAFEYGLADLDEEAFLGMLADRGEEGGV